MIKEGDRLPDTSFVVMESGVPEVKSTRAIFEGRRVALFGLPGAYTPVCHKEHLPGIVSLSDKLKGLGIDLVACTSVNDVFVLDRWSKDHGARGKVRMLADGSAEFAIKTGLAVDLSEFGLGVRSSRYAMIVADGALSLLSVEDTLSDHAKSSATFLCTAIEEER